MSDSYLAKHRHQLSEMLVEEEGELRASINKNTDSDIEEGLIHAAPLQAVRRTLVKSKSSSSTSNEEYLAFKMMRLDLELMGFDKNMIEALLTEYEAEIEDVNHAVELLVRGPNGWTHRYVKNPFT